MDKILEDLFYAKTHEWVKFISDTTARVGITDFAQQELGDLVFINLPVAGDTLTAGEAFGDVESVKAVSDILSPVTGTVAAVNGELLDRPEQINEDPYGSWFVEVANITEKSALMTPAEYREFCGRKEAH
ncbi:MAG: glycine cleavage system protein GcvH [Tannerella sp.]|jgi:glycine cleavage system H protein|nr:glycine cleavage system protein GcvH [Tannerella sp.]